MARKRLPKRINGTCIAGTVAEPRPWFRVKQGLVLPMFGRDNPNPRALAEGGLAAFADFRCLVKQDRPIEGCVTCPAYRHAPSGHNGMWNGEPLSLTEAEYELWSDDDTTEQFYVNKEQDRPALATMGRYWVDPRDDPDVAAYLNERMRDFRAKHPGYDRRKRSRASYMREYRKRRSVTRSDPTPREGVANAK